MRSGEQLSVMERHYQTWYEDLKPGSKRKLKIKITHLTAYKVNKISSALRHKESNYFLGQGKLRFHF